MTLPFPKVLVMPMLAELKYANAVWKRPTFF